MLCNLLWWRECNTRDAVQILVLEEIAIAFFYHEKKLFEYVKICSSLLMDYLMSTNYDGKLNLCWSLSICLKPLLLTWPLTSHIISFLPSSVWSKQFSWHYSDVEYSKFLVKTEGMKKTVWVDWIQKWSLKPNLEKKVLFYMVVLETINYQSSHFFSIDLAVDSNYF